MIEKMNFPKILHIETGIRYLLTLILSCQTTQRTQLFREYLSPH